MEAFKKLGDGVNWAFSLVFPVLFLVVVLGLVNLLVAPVWGAVVALAGACSAVLAVDGLKILVGLAVLAALKFLAPHQG